MYPQTNTSQCTQSNLGDTSDFGVNVPLSPLMSAIREHPQTRFFTLLFSLGTKFDRDRPETAAGPTQANKSEPGGK